MLDCSKFQGACPLQAGMSWVRLYSWHPNLCGVPSIVSCVNNLWPPAPLHIDAQVRCLVQEAEALKGPAKSTVFVRAQQVGASSTNRQRTRRRVFLGPNFFHIWACMSHMRVVAWYFSFQAKSKQKRPQLSRVKQPAGLLWHTTVALLIISHLLGW